MSFDVEVVRQPEKLYRNVKCSGCEVALTPVSGGIREDGAWEHLQPDDTLVLKLDGGYGMAIDPMGEASESDLTILLCRNCTPKMCEQWPAIAKVVQEHVSSSLGHHCSKEKKFVWRPYSDCCYIYCSNCGVSAMNERVWVEIPDELNPGYTKYVEHDRYHRWDVKCKKCGVEGPSVWGWEKVPKEPARKYVHGEEVDDHTICPDPYCCDCDCLDCKRIWESLLRPKPKNCPEHHKG